MDTKDLFDRLAAEEQPPTTVDVRRAVTAGRATRRRRRTALAAGGLAVCLAGTFTWHGLEGQVRGDRTATVVHETPDKDTLPASGVGPLSHAYYDWCGEKWSPGKAASFAGRDCVQWKVVTRDGRTYRMPEAAGVYLDQTAANYMNTAAPLRITPDGRRIAYYSAKDQRFAVRDLASGQVWLSPQTVSHEEMVKNGAFVTLSPEGRYLVLNGRLRAVVDMETGRVTDVPQGWQPMTVARGGDRVIVQNDRSRYGLLEDGRVRPFAGPIGESLSDLAPDGRTVAYLGRPGPHGEGMNLPKPDTIVTVDATTGKVLRRVKFRDAPRGFDPWRIGYWRGPTQVVVSDVITGRLKPGEVPRLGEIAYAVDVTTGEVRKLGTYAFRGWGGDVVIPGM
ncbi:hypothetical protein [Nonomuraea roseoviolacea]|uniref:WD40 repeat domain-containing protein n=1 Tax=Nonomuraea roseoviolacea subsp. carminata TaxID=160689 RepID=A0ABT1K6H5_9ACTN|nr:hypothetical protein [Nonomuraea roseoviolacea]MCP2349605.1 hypothetical protein [Nonomuraea roseoviolacea subsp. carminata]